MKKERLIRTAIALFASMLLLAWASAASAQTACEDALRDAEKSYELGLFEDVPTKLSPCLGTPTSRAVAIHVHSLLARAYLNNDEPEKARKEVSTLLRLDSTFEAGPLPRFSALVAQVRREELTTQVASVSKTNESLREAPATVMVVNAAAISILKKFCTTSRDSTSPGPTATFIPIFSSADTAQLTMTGSYLLLTASSRTS
jgi:hypothetical protein